MVSFSDSETWLRNGRSSRPHRKAIWLAWGVEIIAVAMGLVLATFAGIEGSDNGLIALIVATLPFLALSVIELMKIPLIGLAFNVRSNVWRLLAILALLAITAATFENFVFGFERGFNERIRTVETAEQSYESSQSEALILASDVQQAQAKQNDLEQQIADLDKRIMASDAQAQGDIAGAQANDMRAQLITKQASLQTQLNQIEQRRTAESSAELRRCQVSGSTCYLNAINTKYNKQRDQIMSRLADIDKQLQAERDQIVSETSEARAHRNAEQAKLRQRQADSERLLDAARDATSAAQVRSLRAEEAVAEAKHHRDILVDRSQLHRLSDVVFGNHESAALERTKKLFVVSLAGIVAVIGSVIATMYYAATTDFALIGLEKRESRRQRGLMWRTIRSYYANKRKNLIQERIVTKEVPIDRLKIVWLPVDASEDEIRSAREEALKSARPAAQIRSPA